MSRWYTANDEVRSSGWANYDRYEDKIKKQVENNNKQEKKMAYPVPKEVQEAAKRAVRWIKDGKAGEGFTAVGRARANQLANGEPVSEDVIYRMRSYFARHKNDKQAEGFNYGEKGFPSGGRVAWDAWGGDPGERWANKIVKMIEASKRTNS